MTPDKVEEKSQSEEWGAWKFVSEMLDTPHTDKELARCCIYNTSKCYEQIHDFVVEQKQKAVTQYRQDMMSDPNNGNKFIPGTFECHEDSAGKGGGSNKATSVTVGNASGFDGSKYYQKLDGTLVDLPANHPNRTGGSGFSNSKSNV